jgi:hypothetical protein
MKIETAKYITVLDGEIGVVFQYGISNVGTWNWNPDNESCEEFLTNVGHNLTNCQWMVHENNDIVAHPDINNE